MTEGRSVSSMSFVVAGGCQLVVVRGMRARVLEVERIVVALPCSEVSGAV